MQTNEYILTNIIFHNYSRGQKSRYQAKTIETKVVSLETSTIRRTWWTLIAGKSSNPILLYGLIYKININDFFLLCYLELGKDTRSFDPPSESPVHPLFSVKFSLQMDILSLSYELFFVYPWNWQFVSLFDFFYIWMFIYEWMRCTCCNQRIKPIIIDGKLVFKI